MLQPLASKSRRFRNIPIEFIKSPAQPSREVFEDIDVLASTIKRYGLLEPILVKKMKEKYSFQVVVGERRLRACRKARLSEVPCIIVDGIGRDQILAMQLVENLQRQDLKIFEEVKLVTMLKEQYHLSNEDIAVKIGLSPNTVRKYLLLSRLPEKYIRIINHGSHSPRDLTVTKALVLAKANLPADELKEYVELIKKKGLSRGTLTRKLAKEQTHKVQRVVASRSLWNELTRTPKKFARYWSNYATIKEWETVDAYHLTLQVVMPKDLKEERGAPSKPSAA